MIGTAEMKIPTKLAHLNGEYFCGFWRFANAHRVLGWLGIVFNGCLISILFVDTVLIVGIAVNK